MNKSPFKTVKDVFDHYLSHVVFDEKFCKQVERLKVYFTQKNDEHLHFFSEKLFGAYMVKWLPSDQDMWWIDLLDADEEEIQDALWELPNIRKEFKISSDATNLLFLYLIHRVHHAMLPEKLREKTKAQIMSVCHYKHISSIIAHYFKFGLVNKSVAEATYMALSKRFELKTSKGWGDMLDNRAARLMERSSPHYKTYVNFNDDNAIVRMANDARGRIHATVKQISKEMYDIIEKGEKVQRSNTQTTIDDTLMAKDISRQQDKYTKYLGEVMTDKKSFIKQELIEVIFDSIPNIDREYFVTFLSYLADHYSNGRESYLKHMVTDLFSYTFRLMEESGIVEDDLIKVAEKIRMNFMAGRVNDPLLIKVKKNVDKMITSAVPKLRGVAITSERVGVMIYLILRAFTMRYYSK